jgi:hypothetical protein
MKLPRGERSFGTAFFADLRFSNNIELIYFEGSYGGRCRNSERFGKETADALNYRKEVAAA